MRVIATQKGFHNGSRVKPGTEFSVPEGTKAKWFRPVGEVELEEVVVKAGGKAGRGKKAEPAKAADPGGDQNDDVGGLI